jgi:hypothetical protein
MDKVTQIIKEKSLSLLLYTALYVIVLGFLRWKLTPDITILYYVLGGALGVYFMDIAELIFDIKPSPFHSIVFLGLFAAVSFFIVTSSGNLFAIGLVLSLFFNLLFSQVHEWMTKHTLDSWFTMVNADVPPKTQFWILIGTGALLVIESIVFIR